MEHRKEQHLSALEKGNHHSHKLQRAYNKYGQENFYWEIFPIEVESEKELSLKEIQAIEKMIRITMGIMKLQAEMAIN